MIPTLLFPNFWMGTPSILPVQAYVRVPLQRIVLSGATPLLEPLSTQFDQLV